MTPTHEIHAQPTSESTLHADCCVVGGGPAGVVLALLLARQGVHVVLLEAHANFDRDFRGDTVHPSTLELMDQIGLVDRVLALAPDRGTDFPVHFPDGSISALQPPRLSVKHAYTLSIPQAQFLDLLVEEASRYPSFRLVTGARAEALIETNGKVEGVRFRTRDGWHAVYAQVVVGADGRFSKVRQLAGIPLKTTAQSLDVLWLRLPRHADDPERAQGLYPREGRLLAIMPRGDEWQIGYVFAKGSYQQLRATGLSALRASIAEATPWLADRTDHLRDWAQTSLLSVEAGFARRWHRPGLLLIGDAAHVMSPVAGVGINYAIQDAVVAANRLGPRLLAGDVRERDLASVQRRREWPARVMLHLQSVMQREDFSAARPDAPKPLPARILDSLPPLAELRTRLIAYAGLWPERATDPAADATPSSAARAASSVRERTPSLSSTC